MKFKKKKNTACDAMRCKTETELTIVDGLDLGNLKLCTAHLKEWAVDPPAPTALAAGDSEPDPTQLALSVETAVRAVLAPSESDVLAIVDPIQAEAAASLNAIKSITIGSQAALDIAGSILKDVKKTYKEIEAKRVAITKPLLDRKNAIDELFKPAKVTLLALEDHLKTGIGGYLKQQENARIAALQAGDHETALAVEQPALPSGVGARPVWKFRILDLALIPDEYYVLDMAKVQAHVNAHKSNTDIPGIEAYVENSISARTQ